MSSQIAENALVFPQVAKRLNPAELKIDLLCRGVRIEEKCRLETGRPICSRPGDLASGLELILPGDINELWVNAPVHEKFVGASPYHLMCGGGEFQLVDQEHNLSYSVKLAPNPGWYELRTRRGIPMSQIATLQGTCLMIDLGAPCRFWAAGEELNCRFCLRGEQSSNIPEKTVEDVVETATEAQRKSGTTFVLVRGGYYGAGGISRSFPYIKALKEQVGTLIGLQFPSEPDLSLYDQARALGVDHFNFCLEFFNQDYLDRFAPGKASAIGREHFFKAIEYCVHGLGKGRVSGEIIAGIEPIEDTLRAVDYIVEVGAMPLVCIFRPLAGTEMEGYPAPAYSDMIPVFRHVYEACRSHHLPIGIAPNIHLSAVLHPEDTLYLASDLQDGRSYQRWIFTMKEMMRPYFLRRMRKRT